MSEILGVQIIVIVVFVLGGIVGFILGRRKDDKR